MAVIQGFRCWLSAPATSVSRCLATRCRFPPGTRRGAATTLFLLWCVAVDPAVAEGLTLNGYYDAALVRSEVVASQSELIKQAEERYRQATGSLYPTLSGIASYTWQDDKALNSSISPSRQPNARINATQPLFRGFREFAAMRQTQALVDAQGALRDQARVQLFRDVAQNYYDVLALESDLTNLERQIEFNRARERELQERVRIGKSRVSETLTVQSAVSTLEAQREQIRAQLGTSRDVFAFLSGMAASTALRDTEVVPERIDSLDVYLGRLASRPDVIVAEGRLKAAQESISVARGDHWPSLDLSANRYLERSGNLEFVEWDVQLALTVPLYAGGITESRVREATSVSEQANLDASRVRRLADQELRSLHQTVLQDRAQLEALEKATQSAKRNYEAQQRDYRLGLVTNLDVLQALNSYQENQRALDRAAFGARFNFMRLEAAAARRPARQAGSAP